MLARRTRQAIPAISRWVRMNSGPSSKGPNVPPSILPGFNASEKVSEIPKSPETRSPGVTDGSPSESFASLLNKTKLAAAAHSPPSELPESSSSRLTAEAAHTIEDSPKRCLDNVPESSSSAEMSEAFEESAALDNVPPQPLYDGAKEVSQSLSDLKNDGLDLGLSYSQQALLEEMALACNSQAELDELLSNPDLYHLLALQKLKDVADTPEPILSSLVIPGRGMYPPVFHEPKWRIPVATITFKGYDTKRLELFTHFAIHAASALGIPTSGVYPLPNQRRLWTVLRSPFVFKKTQQNFERITHSRGVKAWDAEAEIVDIWTKVLMANAMPGVGMRVTRWERMEVGAGATELRKVESEIKGVLDRRQQAMGVGERVRQVGEQILAQELATAQAEPDATQRASEVS